MWPFRKKAYRLNPDYAIPPTETTQETLDWCRMADLLARRSTLPYSEALGVVSGSIDIDNHIAEELECVTGTPASFWMNLQSNYDAKLREIGKIKRSDLLKMPHEERSPILARAANDIAHEYTDGGALSGHDANQETDEYIDLNEEIGSLPPKKTIKAYMIPMSGDRYEMIREAERVADEDGVTFREAMLIVAGR